MKREILFRGFCPGENGTQEIWTDGTCNGEKVKGRIKGEWIEGYSFKNWDKCYILWGTTNDIPNMIEVIPETVGQWTGLTDKNGKKIFEHDKVIYGERIDYDLCKESIANPEEYDGIIYDKEIIEDAVVWCGGNGYPAFDLENHDMECNALSEISSSGDYVVEVIGTIFDKEGV